MTQLQRNIGKRMLQVAGFSALLLILMTPLFLLGSRYYHAEERARIAAIIDDPENLETVVWGSSHAECIELDAMGLRGENLFSSAQDLFEVEYKIRALLPYLSRLQTAFISMSYFTYIIDNSISRDPNRSRAGIRVKLYAEYPATLPFIKGDASSFAYGMLHPLITNDHWKSVVLGPPKESIRLPEKPMKQVRRININKIRAKVKSLKENPAADARLLKHAKARVLRYRSLFGRMIERHPGLQSDVFETAVSLIRRLQEKNVRVVLFTPPYYKTYNQRFNRNWKKSMQRSMKALVNQTGVEYFDFSKDAEFESTPGLFKDSDHLNALGSKFFSLKLEERLRESR